MNRIILSLMLIASIMGWSISNAQVTLPWTEDFESVGPIMLYYSDCDTINGLLEWKYEEINFQGRLQFDRTGFAHGGTKAATLDMHDFLPHEPSWPDNTNYLTLELDLSNYRFSTDLTLSFWHRHYGEEGVSDNDRVWVRGSSTDAWREIWNLDANQVSASQWQNITNLDIDALLSSANPRQYPSSTFQIRFGQHDQSTIYSLTSDAGRTFDDILINGTLVNNPLVFDAITDNSSEIDLDWTPNPVSPNVLVAFNTSATFGTPVNGTTYSPGQFLPGGQGQIIYYGTGTHYDHTSRNPNTHYFYKAWTYSSGVYSPGVTDDAFTPCAPVSVYPSWSEGFENSGNPPSCWVQDYIRGNDVDWEFISGNLAGTSPSSAHTGIYNACFQNTKAKGDETMLISPPLDLTGFSPGSVVVSFWHTQDAWLEDQDELYLYYKPDAKSDWILLESWITDINSWTRESVALPGISSTYYIAFKGIARYGKGICVDDLAISGRPLATWTGNSSTNWNTASNWSPSGVPGTTTDVYIPANPTAGRFPELNTGSSATCFNLTIASGAHIHVPNNNSLTVHGTLTNNNGEAGLIVKSASGGTGSLIHETSDVDATVERYLTPLTWHFIGIPVESENAGVFDLPPGDEDIYLRTHIESSNTWDNWIVSASAPLTQGRGYEVWVGSHSGAQPETIVFTGKLGAGDYVTGTGSFYNLQYTPGHGLNLISNPYPSAIEANLVDWTKTNVSNSIWTWDGSLSGGAYAYGNYRYWNSRMELVGGGLGTLTGGIIPSMQGFFVWATGSSPQLTIPQNSRVHSNQAYYKDTSVPANTLRLDVKGNNYEDALFVNFMESATPSFDSELDLIKLFGLVDAPQVYSITPDEKLSINTLPTQLDSTTVVVGFECSETALFTIQASEMESFPPDVKIFLEDLYAGVVQDLILNNTYNFRHDPGNQPDRFRIHFGNVTLNNGGNRDISIYSFGNVVYVQIPSMNNAVITIFDLVGNEIVSGKSESQELIEIELPGKTGYYLVRVQTENDLVSQKVLISK